MVLIFSVLQVFPYVVQNPLFREGFFIGCPLHYLASAKCTFLLASFYHFLFVLFCTSAVRSLSFSLIGINTKVIYNSA
jgi:hypothetical protein